MVVERLELTNFRGFSHLELSFEPDLTVLVGVNGCGKTSVIDALLIGLGLGTMTETDVRVGASECRVTVDVNGEQLSPTTAQVSPRGFEVSQSDAFDDLVLIYTVYRRAVDRTPGSTNPHTWTPDDARMNSRGPSGYEDFFRWFREMEDEENERIRYDQGTESPSLSAIRRTIHELFPQYENLRVRRRGTMGDTRPRLTVEKDGALLLFDALSAGERSLIAMSADIARRLVIAHPDVTDPLTQPCLILIDEFEQHLHPQWQRELPSRLREVFPGAQVILTTHSPIVVSELKPRQLRALRDFELLGASHREGQDVNEILEALFGTPPRKRQTQALIDAADDALDDDDPDQASDTLDALEAQLGSNDPEVVRLRTLQRMLGAQDHDAVSEG